MMGYPFSWFGMGFGFVFMIIFWGALILLIVWLVTQYSKPKESAMEILKRRYAKGDLTKKQYEGMKKEL